MSALRRVPLAWRNLTHNRRRLVLSALGVTFAVALMFTQLGFYYALLDSNTSVIRRMDGELVVFNPRRRILQTQRPFARHDLLHAAGHPQVTQAAPLYFEFAQATLRTPGQARTSIRVLAFDPQRPAIIVPEWVRATPAERAEFERPDVAWIDSRTKTDRFNLPIEDPRALRGAEAELAGRRVEFAGTFELGNDFVNQGTVLMTARNFARFFPRRINAHGGGGPLEEVDVGVLKLRAGADPVTVRDELRERFRLLTVADSGTATGATTGGTGESGESGEESAGRVEVLTRREYVLREERYWLTTTPIGFVFTLGLGLGFVVGVVICYQIIFSGLSELQAEFATVKAMGYSNRYLIGQVFAQAVYLSLLGFFPGWLLSEGLFELLSGMTGLTLETTFWRIVAIYLFTLAMCLVSAALAVRKVLSVDPASLF
jgi:putative ABC transport system permease protein